MSRQTAATTNNAIIVEPADLAPLITATTPQMTKKIAAKRLMGPNRPPNLSLVAMAHPNSLVDVDPFRPVALDVMNLSNISEIGTSHRYTGFAISLILAPITPRRAVEPTQSCCAVRAHGEGPR